MTYVVLEQSGLGGRRYRDPRPLTIRLVSRHILSLSCTWFQIPRPSQCGARKNMSRAEHRSSKLRKSKLVQTKRRISYFYLWRRFGSRVEILYSWQRRKQGQLLQSQRRVATLSQSIVSLADEDELYYFEVDSIYHGHCENMPRHPVHCAKVRSLPGANCDRLTHLRLLRPWTLKLILSRQCRSLKPLTVLMTGVEDANLTVIDS